jgi:membrane-bound lytic murein transglycosylase D
MEKRFLKFTFAIRVAAALCMGAATGSWAQSTPAPVSDLTGTPVNPGTATPTANSATVAITGTQPIISSAPGASNLDAVATEMPDLWSRIRKGFAMPDLEGDLVRDRENWYATRPDYISRMTERSRKYLFHIVEEIERRKMPTELALLPFIESAFNPQALSTAKAAGMWQFIPSTGKTFALKQNAFRDERRDVLASTRAALDYLQKLHTMFGDWHLALAAYNWGEGSVQRAIRKNEAKGLGTGYTDLNMPNETRYYVPKLQAVKNIVARPADFNAPLPSIADHPYFQSVGIQRDIDVTLAAQLSEVTLDDFKALNPSATKPVLLASSKPQILLPWDNASIFENNLNSYSKQLATWTAWHAPRNMRPSDAAKVTGMNEAQLRQVNQIPKGMLIKSGSVLLVPRSAKQADKDVPEHVAENGQTLLMKEPPPIRKVTVKARAGETVAHLAKRFRQSPAMVAKWNNLGQNHKLQAGQDIIFQLPPKPAKGKATPNAQRKSKPAPARHRKK